MRSPVAPTNRKSDCVIESGQPSPPSPLSRRSGAKGRRQGSTPVVEHGEPTSPFGEAGTQAISSVATRYSHRSARSLMAVTRNCGIAFSVLVVSLTVVSLASSRSTFVLVSVFVSPAGISVPVTSTL